MTRTREGLRSTKKTNWQDDTCLEEEDMTQIEQVCTLAGDEIFCYSTTTDRDKNVIYSNLLERFQLNHIQVRTSF